MYDYLHKHKGVFKLPALVGVAMDVSKGMSYLHQNNIIHRDLKTANLLMDENGVSHLIKPLRMWSSSCFIWISFQSTVLLPSILSDMQNTCIVCNRFLLPHWLCLARKGFYCTKSRNGYIFLAYFYWLASADC